jgi:RNA polymerase sigma factor (sigma-70 family)
LLSLDPIDDYLARLEIAEVIATYLTDRQQQIAFYIFVEGWTITRVADELGISRDTVRKDKARLIARIRLALRAAQES